MSAIHEAIADLRDALAAEAEGLIAAVHLAGSHEAVYLMRVAVAAEDASDALFKVLNAAHNYLDDPDAGPALSSEVPR